MQLFSGLHTYLCNCKAHLGTEKNSSPRMFLELPILVLPTLTLYLNGRVPFMIAEYGCVR